MPRFARRGRRGTTKPVHPTKWCGMVPIIETGSTGASIQRVICAADELEEFTNPTIVRIRGTVSVHLIKQNLFGTEQLEVACGIRLTDQQVITAGSLLTKDVHEGPWMWLSYDVLWSTIQQLKVWDGTAAINYTPSKSDNGITHHRYDVDIKAMRRVPQNTALTFNYTWAQLTGAPQLQVVARFRALIKE